MSDRVLPPPMVCVGCEAPIEGDQTQHAEGCHKPGTKLAKSAAVLPPPLTPSALTDDDIDVIESYWEAPTGGVHESGMAMAQRNIAVLVAALRRERAANEVLRQNAAWGEEDAAELERAASRQDRDGYATVYGDDVLAVLGSLAAERALRVSLATENEKLRQEIREYAATVEALEDPERAAVLLADTLDPNDFVEVERPVRPGRYGDHTKGHML